MFFIKFFITFIILFIFWISIIFFQSANPTKSSQWIYDVYNKKTNIANNIQKEKVVIVAGSNALFGINSKMLSDAFNKPVVNYSVNAGLLLPYILYKAKKILKKGDIVILPLEYSMYNYNGLASTQMIDYIFSRDFDAFYTLSFLEQFYMIWNVSFKRLYDGYNFSEDKKITTGLYGPHNINEFGDQLQNSLKYKSKAFTNQLDNYKAKTYGREYNEKALSWIYLKEFNSWCKENDIRCIFIPGAFMKYESYFTDEKERWFYENISKIAIKKGMEFIGEPYDYMFKKELYFNSIYHLTSKGRDKMTQQIISDFQSFSK
ncbi:MAG: hypothetical protein DRG78_19260 [Epsilonproteobacteria bacterium]|nr:MAG: hypothetical protein DRG78_19260 [Campylobacterota bacterium]